jgi:uncharacterized protein YcbX
MRISELHVFPIKGAAGVALTRTTLDAFGMADDRRWMIVDDRGVFVSQREYPELALLRVQLQPDELVIRSTRAGEARLPRQGGPGPTVRVRVWGDTVDAIDAGDVAAHTISAHLGSSVRLVHMPDSSVRGVDPDYGRASDRVSFADAFPLLLICQESLNTLNARLAEAIPMLRFRPNVVVAGAPAHAEDEWRRIRLGSVECDVVKPCSRCAATTVDPATGMRGKEPLRTLASYRAWNQKVWFGQNLIHRQPGEIAVGDQVEVLDVGPARPPLVAQRAVNTPA